MQLHKMERSSGNLSRISELLICTTGLETKARSVYVHTYTCTHMQRNILKYVHVHTNTHTHIHTHITYRSECLIMILANTHQQANVYFQINFAIHSLKKIYTHITILQPIYRFSFFSFLRNFNKAEQGKKIFSPLFIHSYS